MSVTRLDVLEVVPDGVAVTPLETARRLFRCGRATGRDAYSLSGAQRFVVDFPDEGSEDEPRLEDAAQLALLAEDEEQDEARGYETQVRRHMAWLARRGFLRRVGADHYELVADHVRERTHRGRIYLTGPMPAAGPRRRSVAASPEPVGSRLSVRAGEETTWQRFMRTGQFSSTGYGRGQREADGC